ncbi:MAG TPA: hypothetical protein VLS92_00600, partial [Acidimicrobiia bacterium]|nr:hypothetical protein [Acidimicrobiia bacterium]
MPEVFATGGPMVEDLRGLFALPVARIGLTIDELAGARQARPLGGSLMPLDPRGEADALSLALRLLAPEPVDPSPIIRTAL